jgi:hypothetical protein
MMTGDQLIFRSIALMTGAQRVTLAVDHGAEFGRRVADRLHQLGRELLASRAP